MGRFNAHDRSALVVALAYCILAGLWIAGSDRLVAMMFDDAALRTNIGMYKGWGFVLVTGLLLYVVLSRRDAQRNRLERDFHHAFESAPNGLAIMALDHALLRVNPALCELLQVDAEALPGASFHDFIHIDDATTCLDAMERLLRNEQEQAETVIRFVRADNQVIWGKRSLSLVRDGQGEPLYYILQVVDLTAQKEAELAAEAHAKRLAALRQIDVAITASLDLGHTLNVFLNEVVGRLEVDAARVFLVDEHTDTLQLGAAHGFTTPPPEGATVPLSTSRAVAAVERREVVEDDHLVVSENADDAWDSSIANEGFDTYEAVPLIFKGTVRGVLETFRRGPFQRTREWVSFRTALAGQAAIAIDNASLFSRIQHASQRLQRAYDATIEGWGRALELRDKETEGHTRRTTEWTLKLARRFDIPDEDLPHIRRGALLHDIGKMGIPDDILLKPGPLSEGEWKVMRTHPMLAYKLLSPINYLRPALDIPHYHHERWDGSGYPDALRGEEIPLPARLFAVVDIWDALLSDRPYRDPWPEKKVRRYLNDEAGRLLDPAAVAAFIDTLEAEATLQSFDAKR